MSGPKEAQQQQSKERKRLLGYEAVAVERHREVPSAAKLVGTRKVLIAHVKEIAASGNAEAIIEMEKDFIQNDLDRYAKTDDKEMTGSLNAALLGVAAIKQQLEMVDDPQKYQAIDRGHALPKNRKHGLPLDEARQSFVSYRARLGNYVKCRLEENEKQLVRERRKALGIAEKDYIRRQAKTLGVELAQSAKPTHAEKPQAALQSQKDLDPER